jgi:hypothetical protein
MDERKAELQVKRKAELQVKYDARGDVLYVSFGEPRKAIGEEISDGLVVRRDLETDEVVGFTVVDFAKRFERGDNYLLKLPIPPALLAQAD